MIIQSIPHLESVISSSLAKIKEAETHISFWTEHAPEYPDMVDEAKRCLKYKETLEIYEQAIKDLEKLKSN